MKNSIPILLEQELIFHNYLFELYLNRIPFSNYKKHSALNQFENFILTEINSNEIILINSLYYLNYLILNDKIITNSSLNFMNNKNKDAKIEVICDVLNILPLCSQIYIYIEKQNKDKEFYNKLYSIYKLCKNMYLLGQQLTNIYIKDGDFIKEIDISFIELVKSQMKSGIEDKLVALYQELKKLKEHLIEKEQILYDVAGEVKEKLFTRYFSNEAKNKSSMQKISKNDFLYWDESKNNIFSSLNLYFIEKYDSELGNEIKTLKNIEKVSTSLIFFLEYENVFWKQKSYNSISLKFFMDNNDLMKYAYIQKHEDKIKELLKSYYNLSSIESFVFKKHIKQEITAIKNAHKNDIEMLLNEISRKIPKVISDGNFILSDENKDKTTEDLSIALYKIFTEVLQSE